MAGEFGKTVRERLVKMGKKKPSKESVTEALDDLLDKETKSKLESDSDGEDA